MMRVKKSTLVIAGVAGLAGITALTGFAMADMEGGWHGRGRDRGMFWQGMIERYDANNDGKITQDEINNNRQAWYAEFDLDKDGKLSLVEFEKLWLKARHRMMVREFQFLDVDGDGNVTLLEYKEPLQNIVADRDRNGDGALSRDDRPPRGDGDRGKQRWRHRDHMQQQDNDGPGDGDGDGPDDN